MIAILSKLSAKEKRILFVAIFFVVIALFDRFFLGPITDRIDLIKEEISQQETNVKTDLKLLSYENTINKEDKIFSKYYSEGIPEDGTVNGEILGLLERISAQSNIKLSKSSPSRVEKNQDYVEYFFDVDCEGALKDIISFIHAINSTDQLLKVDRFKMTPRRGTENEVKVSLQVVKLLVDSKISE